MTNNEINTIESEIKFIVRQQSSNSLTQASATASTPSNTISNTDGRSTTKKEKTKSLLNYFLDTLDGEDNKQMKKQPSTLSKVMMEEFKIYKKLAVQFVSTSIDICNPIVFWKQNKNLLPNLSPLAQKYLSSPGTSTKAESAFSVSGYYARKQRARLSSENLCCSVFLKDKL